MLPQLNRVRKSTTGINVFRGLNVTENTGFSRVSTNSSSIYTEFKNMKNMSSDDYPLLAPRHNRTRLMNESSIDSNLLCVNDTMCFISGNTLYLGTQGKEIEDLTADKHHLVSYGNNILIMPEKLIYSISDDTLDNIDYVYEAKTYNPIGEGNTIYLSSLVHTDYDWGFHCAIEKTALNTSVTAKRKIGAYFGEKLLSIDQQKINTQVDNTWVFKNVVLGDLIEVLDGLDENDSTLYMCTGIKEADTAGVYIEDKIRTFTRIDDVYFRIIGAKDFFDIENINIGDYVKLSGFTDSVVPEWNEYNENKSYMDVLNDNYFKVYGKGACNMGRKNGGGTKGNYIIIKANLKSSVPYTGNFKIERVMPELDEGMMIECNNRIWSCSSKDNSIYCCKQGDVKNWQAYGDGISTDSYFAVTGCEGDFTGIAVQNDSVIFFKENWIMKLYGTKPSNYTLSKYNVAGIAKGSGKSVVWINGALYYMSKQGVCQYQTGAQPVIVSEQAFGNEQYKNAVAGRYKNKYYISAENNDGEYVLFVYDTLTGLWHKEDDARMIDTCTYNQMMYFVDKFGYINSVSDNSIIENMSELGEVQKERCFEWFCETGDLYDSEFMMKHISRIRIGVKSEKGTWLKILVKYAENDEWVKVSEITFDRKKAEIVPLAVRRTEYIRLRIEGVGQCKIYGIDIEYSTGSDKK